MPAARKRSGLELDSRNDQAPKQPSTLSRIRNMWQFANLFQFILLFGTALKLDDSLDIEDLEAECLKPGSMTLQDIGLGLLKFLSSHRGLTYVPNPNPDQGHAVLLFDEYTRRQFTSKAPEKNPFGTGETPARFADFDAFTKIRVLQQMTQLIMMNPERLRERTEEQKDVDQTNWRIEPYGWDRQDRTYFVLDDNRLYRLTETPPALPKSKKNTKKSRAAQRANKRRRVSSGAASDTDDAGDEASESGAPGEPEDDGLGGMKWECVAVALDEVRDFLSTIQKSKDANEKTLRDQIQNHLVPILEKQEESRNRKQLQREKEMLSLEKMAHAKRSSRLAGKIEQQKMEERTREEELRRREEDAAKRKEEHQRLKLERERDNRLMSRERRLRERDARRRLHEEELSQLSEDSKAPSVASGRMSERRRQAEIEKNMKALQELEEEEDDWIFDCACGVFGQIDDGTHSVACERCNTWQHSKCLGIDEADADRDDFHFICNSCRQRDHAADEPRPRIIKIKVNRQEQPGSPPREHAAESTATSQQAPTQLVVELQSRPATALPVGVGQLRAAADGGLDEASTAQSVQPPVTTNLGQGSNPFSSPHPRLLPPDRQPTKPGTHNPTSSGPTPVPSGDDEGRPGLVDGAAEPSAVPSMLAGSGSGSSPSKQAHRPPSPPTKTPLPAPATSAWLEPSVSAENINGMASSSIALPHFTPTQSRQARSDAAASSPLPPPSGGLSPTKQSPPVPQKQQVNSGSNPVATPLMTAQPPAAVFPPVAALSPSPRQQILTPPVKLVDPVRVPPEQGPPI
ncbi:hypothetical protein BT67DRAFT_444374 [Trichocladium antarcticum]|uniref:Zinc finger PHD-type domain-containing protein n=1 Tax=Trichocladium antarcticum TaxID=1450529 RepID=A0AAN6ZBQ8_9PEZI|nr:hypothetical protein BT67DRAFT_444374 [Trichocladium antarcticum]